MRHTDQPHKLVKRENEEFGCVTVLFSRSGIAQQHKIADAPDEEWVPDECEFTCYLFDRNGTHARHKKKENPNT